KILILHAPSGAARAVSRYARRPAVDLERETRVRRRRLRVLPHTELHDRQLGDCGSAGAARESVLGPAGARHGHRPCRWCESGTGGPARVPDGPVVGAGAANLLPARRENVGSARGNSGALRYRIRSQRRDSEFPGVERQREAGSAQLPAIVVDYFTSTSSMAMRSGPSIIAARIAPQAWISSRNFTPSVFNRPTVAVRSVVLSAQ